MSEFKLSDLPVTHLEQDGSIKCRNCGKVIEFLPEQLLGGVDEEGTAVEPNPPASVNHTGCPNSVEGESPAGPDLERGQHETINRIDPAEVHAFYERKSAS